MDWLLPKYKKVGFEDMLSHLYSKKCIIINTLSSHEQGCLISNTIQMNDEERAINEMIDKYENKVIIIYGKNSIDESVEKKYKQLIQLGLNVYIYTGGLFEWILLQDIYGETNFPTTTKITDLLIYRPLKNPQLT